MKHFSPGIVSKFYTVDILIKRNGIFIIFTFNRKPKRFLKDQHVFVGRVHFKRGFATYSERFSVIQEWVNSLDYKVALEKFYNSGFKTKPVFAYMREAEFDFNVTLEELFDENLLKNSWRSLETDEY